MSAQQLLLPFRPVINLRGGLEAGATLEVYESGGLTPYPIYADEDLTEELANPLEANGFGIFPAVYFDESQPIRVIVKAANGTVIDDSDPYLADGLPASSIVFQQTGSNTVQRDIQDKAAEVVSVTDFSSVELADNDSRAKFVPPGTYPTSLTSLQLDGPYYGLGQIQDFAGNKRGREFCFIKAPPASTGNWDSPETAFNGDLSKVVRIGEYRIGGATTLGQPSTGYSLPREVAHETLYGFVSSEAGWNQSTTTNNGRSGAAFWQRQVFHAGNGDAFCNWVSGIATGTKAGSTHWLANPAIVLYGGQAFAGANGVFLQGLGDLNFNDLGYDAACQGLTFNFIRTNKTGAKNADWTGMRLQTQGTQGVNAWFAAVGVSDLGIDFSASNFGTNQAAMALAEGHRIYFASSNGNPESLSRFTNFGSSWIEHSTSVNGFSFAVGSTSRLQINSSQVTVTNAKLETTGKMGLTGTLPLNFPNDAAAAAGGVAIGEAYRNGSVVHVRVS